MAHLAVLIQDLDLALVPDDDQRAVLPLDDFQLAESDRAGDLRLDPRLLDDASRDAADVEGPKRKLRAGLADRLRRDDARGLTQLDHASGREISPVTLRADAARRLALQDRPDRDFLDPPALFDRFRGLLRDLLARADDHVSRIGVDHILDRDAPEHTVS